MAAPFPHRAKRMLKPTQSESAILTSSEMAGQRYGVPQHLTETLGGSVGMRVRKNVTEGYKQHHLVPPAQASSQLIHPFSHSTPSLPTLGHPAQDPSRTFVSASEAYASAHLSLEEQRQAEAVRALKPANPLMGYHATFDAGALGGRRKSNGDIDMDIPAWRGGGWAEESRARRMGDRGRGTKRGQGHELDEDEDEDEGEATDTDEPVAPSRHDLPGLASFHSASSFSTSTSTSSGSTMLHPLAASASSATNAQNLHNPVPIDPWAGAGWGGKRREPLRPTKSLPVRAGAGGSWGMGMGGLTGPAARRMDGVEETMEDGFDVAEWAARTDF